MEKFKKLENEDTEVLFLCRPCAEKLKTMNCVKHIHIGESVKKKGDCEQCGRRRYGYKCTVEWKDLDI